MIKSICIVRLSALGDIMMTVPLIRTLQTHLPNAALTWVISRPAYDLVEGMDGVEFIVIDKPNGWTDYWQFYKRMRARKFDVLLAIQSSFRANLLYPMIRATRKIGYDSLRAKDGHAWFIQETITPGCDHTLDGFLKFAEKLSIDTKEIRWDLPISKEERDRACAYVTEIRNRSMSSDTSDQGPLVFINPAASKPERSWLAERYVDVIRYLQTHWQARVVLIGGPSMHDKALGDKITEAVSVDTIIGKTKPKQLLALIEQADLVICPDTGPSHMAVAVGTPVLALHAVTSAHVSGPYLYRHWAVDCYPEAVKTILKKTPETNVWGTHAHGSETMSLVTVDAVIARLEQIFPAGS